MRDDRLFGAAQRVPGRLPLRPKAALDVIGESIRRIPAQRYIERYQAVLATAVEGGRKKTA